MTPPDWSPNDVINEIISELSLRRKVKMAKLSAKDIEMLQSIFDKYIGVKTGLASGDSEYSKIMSGLWERLKEKHLIRRVK